MQAAENQDYVSVSEYLVAEAASAVRHEYPGGLVSAMAGETRDHNQMVGNLLYAIRRQVKGTADQVPMIDIRVNLQFLNGECFYSPDLVVTGDQRDSEERFIRYPKLIVEVLSESTERVDRHEKFFAYTQIETLEEYVLVAPSGREVMPHTAAGARPSGRSSVHLQPERWGTPARWVSSWPLRSERRAPTAVTVFRRADNWKGETVTDTKGSVALKSLRLEVPLAEIYEGV
ncbi:hypothetical protein LBMAG56_12610 [Verrucomicrobiota bacterium]|nr:hypothetical protein LBMAG56_12610 [Verrucomicrobiota bacterium]